MHNVTMKVNIKIGNPVKSSAGARWVSPGLHPVSPVSPDGSALVHIGLPRSASARIQWPHPGIPCLCLACPHPTVRCSTQYDGMPGLPGILPTIANCLTFKMPRRGGRGPPYLQNMNKYKVYFSDSLNCISLIFVLWLVVDDQHRRLEESSSCWRTAFSRPKASNYAIGPLLLKLFPLQRLYISCFRSFSLYRCTWCCYYLSLHQPFLSGFG